VSDDFDDDEDGVDDPSGDEESGEGSRRQRVIKLVLLIGLPILVLSGAAVGVFFSGLVDPLLGIASNADNGMAEVDPLEPGFFLEMDELLINLAVGSRQPKFLKIRMSLELEGAGDEAKLLTAMPRVIDNLNGFLRELRVEELQGSQGMARVRKELLARVNEAARPTIVRDVLFNELLIQ
jgi:flagellar protein FliL